MMDEIAKVRLLCATASMYPKASYFPVVSKIEIIMLLSYLTTYTPIKMLTLFLWAASYLQKI